MAEIARLNATGESETPHRTLFQMAIRRFFRHRMAVAGLTMLVFVVLYTVGGAFLFSEADANFNDTSRRLVVSEAHPLGTDNIGRDMLARSIYGGQISLIIGLFAMTVSVSVGITVGVLSGYFGGWVDNVLMRLTEAMLSIPTLLLLLLLANVLGNRIPELRLFGRGFSGSVLVIIFIIGATSWMYLARIIRGNILSLKTSEYVLAARALGANDWRIITRHLLPNTLAPIVVAATLGVAQAILQEAYISFLGVGVKPPTATWGNILEGAKQFIHSAPWLWLVPSTLILITVMGINFVGDGLRDALDPRTIR
jgi:peptide/nickel transport system permease protein